MVFYRVLCVFLILMLLDHGRCEALNGGRVACYVLRTSYMPLTALPGAGRVCTHITVAFAEINGITLATPSSTEVEFYNAITKLKATNPSLSVLISLQRDFSGVIQASDQKKQSFAVALSDYVKKYNFDGADFDWEPSHAVTPTERQGYMKLLQIIRHTFDNDTTYLGSPPRQMSAALIPSIPRSKTLYDVPVLAKVLDFATAMTYDYHSYRNKPNTTTGYNSPLYAPSGERKDYCTDGTIRNYIALGMPSSKLLLGLPTYGRTYTLGAAAIHGLHAPAIDKGKAGPVRGIRGLYTYQDACIVVKGSTRVWDDKSMVPYLYNQTTWASYDNIESSIIKCLYVINNKLGGAGIWALHLDDYNGMCGQGLFPLVDAVGSCLKQGRSLYLKYQSQSNRMANKDKFGFA